MDGKVRAKADAELMSGTDVILSMTCNIGALCAERVFRKEVLNPIVTVGAGFIDENRKMFVCGEGNKKLTAEELSDAAAERGLRCDPYA